ncbi:MAG: hypothetical protein JSW71_23355 [Gemmatimonadota bacterium]|nr:MAG: hypothetical protein JSW71_23355 [Gemmatimonadota bacterium]
MRLPPQPFLRAILLRSTIIWIGVRIAATAVVRMVPEWPGEEPAPPYALAPPLIAAVIVLTTALTVLDCARHNEVLYLTNLGVSRRTLVLAAGLLPLLYSVATAVLVRL